MSQHGTNCMTMSELLLHYDLRETLRICRFACTSEAGRGRVLLRYNRSSSWDLAMSFASFSNAHRHSENCFCCLIRDLIMPEYDHSEIVLSIAPMLMA